MKIKILTIITVTLLLSFINSGNIFAQMFWNQACSFAGTGSSYISCRSTPTTEITGNFTLEAWIKPNSLNSYQGIILKGSPLGLAYALRIIPGGRIEVITNTAIRISSKATSSIPLNQWTHIAATFHFNTFVIYINGAFDTSAIVNSATPVSTGDSLFIGSYRAVFPFSGMMDEVRIWNRDLSSIEILRNMRLTLGTNSGAYSGLILSMTFQKENSAGAQFTANDWSNNGNFGTKVGVAQVNLSDQPSATISTNQCISFFNSNGNDYLAGADNDAVSPVSGITLQAWVYPRSNLTDRPIIHKGAPNGATANYSLNIINQKLGAKINNGTFDSQDTLPLNQWSHVAFTYYFDGVFRYYNFYVNGKRVRGQLNLGGSNITDGPDSLYIGGTNLLTNFYGYIDEVRISKYAKQQAEIIDSMYTSMENGFVTPQRTVTYSFDGYTYCNSLIGPFLYFRNSAYFTFPLTTYSYPVSPLDKGYSLNFQKGFYMKTSDRAIPETGSNGPMIDDSLSIALDESLNDINVYIALNHEVTSDLQVSLVAPNGTSVLLMNSNSLLPSSYHVVTVFDDQAAFPLINNTYVTLSPTIRPLNNINTAFGGANTKGIWKLVINDNSPAFFGSGRLYAWGIQFNNKSLIPKIISSKSLIQGFYNSNSNTVVRDTVRSYIRYTYAPYAIIDSSKSYLQSDGTALFAFNSSNLIKGINYFIQQKHRNSIETWSNSQGVTFEPLTSQGSYDFTTDSTKAFGNNLISVDNSPVSYAFYSGDVNQDGIVNLNDIILTSNDATNFVTGYINTDVTGDNVANLSDILLAFNNSNNFVVKITP